MILNFLRKMRKSPFFSPLGLLDRAITLTAMFLAVHFAGFRRYTSFISGTINDDVSCNVLGVGYFILYASVIIAVPILIIASLALIVIRSSDRTTRQQNNQ